MSIRKRMGVNKKVRGQLKAAIGRLDLVEFAKASKGLRTFAELEKAIERDLGSS